MQLCRLQCHGMQAQGCSCGPHGAEDCAHGLDARLGHLGVAQVLAECRAAGVLLPSLMAEAEMRRRCRSTARSPSRGPPCEGFVCVTGARVSSSPPSLTIPVRSLQTPRAAQAYFGSLCGRGLRRTGAKEDGPCNSCALRCAPCGGHAPSRWRSRATHRVKAWRHQRSSCCAQGVSVPCDAQRVTEL